MKISLFKGILFGVFGLAAFIGIFVFATYSNKGGSTSTGGPVVIWGTLPSTSMQDTLTALGQVDETFKTVSYVQKNQATLASDLGAAIATGAAPDLVLASQEELHALTKFITPIPSSLLPTSTFTNAFIEEGGLLAVPGGAGYYGVPFLVDPLVLFSNRAILSSNNIAKPPATWEALTGLVSKVATLTSSGQVVRGLIGLGTYDNVHNALGILSTLFLQTGVSMSGYATNGVLVANLSTGTTANSSQAGQAVLGFYTQFTDPSKVSYTWNASLPDSQQAFLAGNLALYLGYASEARYLTQANPNLNFSVSSVPQPATAQTKSVYGQLYAFVIPRGAKNPDGAYQVSTLLTNSAEQAAAAAATGLAPVALSQLAAAPTDPVAAVAYAEALYAKGWLSPAPTDTNRVFSGMIGNVISGRSSLGAALVSAEQSLSALLQQ